MKMKGSARVFAGLVVGTLILFLSLTFVEQTAAQSCVPPPSGLVSWWPGEGDASDIQSGNDGTLHSVGFATGMVGLAFNFLGGAFEDFVEIADSPSLRTGTFTIGAWIKTSLVPPEFKPQFIVARSGPDGLHGYELFVNYTNGLLRGGVLNGISSFAEVIGTTNVADGQWHHAALTYDGQSLLIYVDGQLEGAQAFTSGPGYVAGDPLRIGTREYPFAKTPFQGLIDEVEFFDRALAAAEIQAIFAAGSGGKCKASAADDAYNVDEDTTLMVPAPGVLGNDTDLNGDALTAVLVSGPSHGLLTLNADGSFTYMPESNFSGSDTFMYKASDGSLDSNIAIVTISVNQVNDPPVAQADGPYLGVVGIPVAVDASASVDVEGASRIFTWNFGDGSAPVTTPQEAVQHIYSSPGVFAVTLVVNDGELDSNPFTTNATIGFPDGGQRAEVNDFLTYASPVTTRTDLPAGTTSFSVTIIYGPTIIPSTFRARLNGGTAPGFTAVSRTSQTVSIALSPGRNVLELQVDGVMPDGRTATDRDRLTFIVP